MPPGEPVIVAESLNKSFGETVAVKDLSFEVPAGTIFGLLGPNGAGKSTTINMLTTLLPIDRGRAAVAGVDVTEHPDGARRMIGLAGQAAAVDGKLTARENLELFGRLYKIPKSQRRARVAYLIERFRMTEYADRTVDTYSGGQKRRLDVVASLVANPPALFLDEPTTGLDPRSRVELWDEIRGLADAGTAVVLTTQYLDEADRLSDDIAIIDRGTVVGAGKAEDLKDDLQRDVLEAIVASEEEVDVAEAALREVVGDLGVERSAKQLTIPVADSASSLGLLRRVQDAGVTIEHFSYRRPTLEDVFITYTEAASEQGVSR